MSRRPASSAQRGAVTMLTALLVLVALALIGMTGTRLALMHHRISGNSARGDAAFAAAEAGVQNALAYLNANRTRYKDAAAGGWRNGASTPHWTPCTAGLTALPCGNGSGGNLYGAGWSYYGPVPNVANQSALTGTYAIDTWYLSNTITAAPATPPYLGCTDLALTGLVPGATATAIGLVNTLLNTLGTLLGQPGLRLPANLCLPINFAEEPWGTWPSSINPSVTIVASAAPPASGGDVAAGAAAVQQATAMTNLFANLPPAALMVDGTVNLAGDIRVWGNMRPPTVAPLDFSVLHLNNVNVAGVPVGSTLATTVGGLAGSIASGVNISFAPVMNVTSSQIVAMTWNVTFPLSIWSSSTTTLLSSSYTVLSALSGARTCDPVFDGTAASACTPLSESVTATYLLSTQAVQIKLPDIEDFTNLANTSTGLVGGTLVPCFPGVSSPSCAAGLPPTMFEFTFGYPPAQSSRIQQLATAATDCSAPAAGGFYWVTGNCALSGTIGSATAPVTIVATGNVTLAAGTYFYGVIYLSGSAAKTFAGPGSGTRPTVQGAVLSEGALGGSGIFNIAYDANVVRTAGFAAGSFAPVPGGWNDAPSGP